jgi:hypothetical protein
MIWTDRAFGVWSAGARMPLVACEEAYGVLRVVLLSCERKARRGPVPGGCCRCSADDEDSKMDSCAREPGSVAMGI